MPAATLTPQQTANLLQLIGSYDAITGSTTSQLPSSAALNAPAGHQVTVDALHLPELCATLEEALHDWHLMGDEDWDGIWSEQGWTVDFPAAEQALSELRNAL